METRGLWLRARSRLAARRVEKAATDRVREMSVARGEACPSCYQSRGEAEFAARWFLCVHEFHDRAAPRP